MLSFKIMNFTRNLKPGTLLATADVCIENSVTICGARLVARKNGKGSFLSLPTRKVGDKYYREVLVIDKQLHKEIEKELCTLVNNTDL